MLFIRRSKPGQITDLHLYIYTNPLTINISHLNNYSDFQQAHFLTVHKRIQNRAIKHTLNAKARTQKPKNKAGLPHIDAYPIPGPAGQGPLRIGHFG